MNKNSAFSFFIQSCFGSVGDGARCDLKSISYFHARKKREFLFHEGAEGRFGYFLASGLIKLFKTSKDGKEVTVNFVSSGELIGWLVLLLERRYPVSAVCLEPVETLAIDIRGIRSMLRDHPDFTMRMFGYIARRQKAYLNSIRDLAVCCPRMRFLNYLNCLSGQAFSPSFRLPAPKGEIALLLGITPETLSRLIRRFVDEGIISIEGKDVCLLKQPCHCGNSEDQLNNRFFLDSRI